MYINIDIEKKHYIFQYNYFINEFLNNNKNINLKNEFLINYFILKKQFFKKFKKQFSLYDFFLLISIERIHFNIFNFFELKLCKKTYINFIKNLLNQLIEFKFIKVYDFINKLYFYLIGSSGDNIKKYKKGISQNKNKLYIDSKNIYNKYFFYQLYVFIFNKFISFTPYSQYFLLNLHPLLFLFYQNITNNLLNTNFNKFLNTLPYSNLKIFKTNFWSILNSYKKNILILINKNKFFKNNFKNFTILNKKINKKINKNLLINLNSDILNIPYINYINNLKKMHFNENIYLNLLKIEDLAIDTEITFKRNSKFKSLNKYV